MDASAQLQTLTGLLTCVAMKRADAFSSQDATLEQATMPVRNLIYCASHYALPVVAALFNNNGSP